MSQQKMTEMSQRGQLPTQPCSWWCEHLEFSLICGTKLDMVFEAGCSFLILQKQKLDTVV